MGLESKQTSKLLGIEYLEVSKPQIYYTIEHLHRSNMLSIGDNGSCSANSAPFARRGFCFATTLILLIIVFASLGQLPSPQHPATHKYTPVVRTESRSDATPFWFIGTISPAPKMQRRMIIRQTWQSLYRNDSLYTMKFIISKPTDLWRPLIEAENATHGDIIELPHLEENSKVANTVKTMHYLKHLVSQNRKYMFVTKIDDDSFLNVPAFVYNYLHPLMNFNANPPQLRQDRTVIGRPLTGDAFEYPGGQFYTMTWDVVARLTKLYAQNSHTDVAEDMLVGKLHHDAGEGFELVKLPNRVAFDYYDNRARGDGTAWGAEDNDDQLDDSKHAIGPGTINPHKMWDDVSYLRVAACFGVDGLLDRPRVAPDLT